jgi:hypothetical protein
MSGNDVLAASRSRFYERVASLLRVILAPVARIHGSGPRTGARLRRIYLNGAVLASSGEE